MNKNLKFIEIWFWKNNLIKCRCLPGFVDSSPRTNPGRLCQRAPACKNQHLNDCHQFAECIDLTDNVGYQCHCLTGYLDRSPDPVNFPGRLCASAVTLAPTEATTPIAPSKHFFYFQIFSFSFLITRQIVLQHFRF